MKMQGEIQKGRSREGADRTTDKGEEGCMLGTEEDGVLVIGRDGAFGTCCCAMLLLHVWYGILCAYDK
jgi:hypothetical protein